VGLRKYDLAANGPLPDGGRVYAPHGHEVHTRSPAGTEQKPRPPRQDDGRLSTDKLRRARVRCWCGTRRYVKCHGAIPAEQELEILGLV
jgi:hypothetical protein